MCASLLMLPFSGVPLKYFSRRPVIPVSARLVESRVANVCLALAVLQGTVCLAAYATQCQM